MPSIRMALRAIILIIPWICSGQLVPGEEINLTGEPGQGYTLEILIGTPPQKLNVILDTGSSTFGVAGSSKYVGQRFFQKNNSSTLHDSGYQVEENFTEGGWIAELVTDMLQIPSLPSVPAVATDVALITGAHDFFSNESNWQGILGVAYPNAGATGPHVIAKPWLGYLSSAIGRTVSFSLTLCGPTSPTNASHYGSFRIIDESKPKLNNNKTFRTPILREIWYEVGTIAVRVINNKNDSKSTANVEGPNRERCNKLNEVKSIVDSGTSNLRIPEPVYEEVVKQLQEAALAANYALFDNFWQPNRHELSQFSCWPQPHVWDLPWLAIDLLSADHPNQYFTIELPPENYMHPVSAVKMRLLNLTSSGFCYYLGLQSSGNSTILGVTVLDGFEITFNISAGYIAFQTSPCGPNVKITGPYNSTENLLDLCSLHKSLPKKRSNFTRVLSWVSILSLVIAMTFFFVLMAPIFRQCYAKFRFCFVKTEMSVSMSRSILVED